MVDIEQDNHFNKDYIHFQLKTIESYLVYANFVRIFVKSDLTKMSF